MKKFFALVLALVLSLFSASAASAVTFDIPGTITTADSTVTVRAEEEVRFILDKAGKPVGVLDAHEGEYRNNLGIVVYGGGTVTSAMTNGKVVRAKNIATVTLNADNMLLNGSSRVTGTLEVLDESVAEFSAAELIDLTVSVVCDNGDGTFVAYHRFIDNDDEGTKVALFHLPSGKKVSIWLTDWDGDGVRDEYALRAGLSNNSTGGGNTNGGGSNNNGGGDNDNGGGGNTSVQPNPENDPVVLPPSIGGGSSNDGGDSSGGSTSSPAPNPENDNVTLPWG